MKRFSTKGVAGQSLSLSRRGAALIACVGLSILLCPSAQAGTTNYTNAGTYSYTVPNGVIQLQLQVSGAGGGGGGADGNAGGNGGNGDKVTATLDVTPGQIINLNIGAGGQTGWTAGPNYSTLCGGAGTGGSGASSGAVGGGANCQSGISGASGISGGGGGGGGSTSLSLNGGPTFIQAAGGGGGGGAHVSKSGLGGSANANAYALLADCNGNGPGTAGSPALGNNGTLLYANDGGGGGGYQGGTGGVGHLDNDAQASTGGTAGQSCISTNAKLSAQFFAGSGSSGASGQSSNALSSSGTGTSGYVSITTVPANPSLSLVKAASTSPVHAGGVQLGDTITYTYTVTNTGGVALTGVNISDTHHGKGTLSAISNKALANDAAPTGDSTDSHPGSGGVWDTLGPGDTVTFKSTYTVTQLDVDLLN